MQSFVTVEVGSAPIVRVLPEGHRNRNAGQAHGRDETVVDTVAVVWQRREVAGGGRVGAAVGGALVIGDTGPPGLTLVGSGAADVVRGAVGGGAPLLLLLLVVVGRTTGSPEVQLAQ